MLAIDRLTRRYGAKTAVDDVNLQIPTGQFVGVIGRSGAGKSTLLRMINRLETPTSGTIAYGDLDVTRLKGAGLSRWRARCAMIFQQFNLVGRLDVLTNVLVGRLNHVSTLKAILQIWTDEDIALALSALEQLDIAPLAAQRADSLSGGQQQRVAIARAVIGRPKLLLADEPTGNVDDRIAVRLIHLFEELNKVGTTVVIATHNESLIHRFGHPILKLDRGELARLETLDAPLEAS